MKNFSGHVALITGAASGIGRELAKQLAVAGCDLALADIDEAGLRDTQQQIENKRAKVSIHKVDIAREQEVRSLIDDVVVIHHRISILINNAGVSISSPFEKVSVDDYRRLIDTNFWGAIYTCKYALPFLRKERAASIVNVLSNFAILGFPNKTAYCSSKGALLGFSNALYTELYDTNVKVCLVIPPAVDTNLLRSGLASDDSAKQKEVDFIARNGMPVEKVARKIIAGVTNRHFRITIGMQMRVIDCLCRWFPTATHVLLARNKSRFGFL
jgi:short-subunit dehydrogenase